ncbi:MAG: sulfatase [Planctomycetes bacterium]|nr:sulfatase [Planctomycetota bacterium]
MKLSPRLLAPLVALVACAPAAERGHGGRGVLLVVVDSLRADHFGAAGYDRDTTPTLDALAERGVWFEQAFSPAPDLIPAHAAILTGCDPRVVRVPLPQAPGVLSLSRQWRMPPELPSLAAEFLAQGFHTAAFVDHPWLSSQYGFDRGFQAFDEFSGGTLLDRHDFGAGGIGRSFTLWLSSLADDADWFAYLTINDLERSISADDGPWQRFFEPRAELDEVPPVVRAQRAFFAVPDALGAPPGLTIGEHEARYDGALRQLDTKLDRLLAQLDAKGRLEETTVVLVGAYGMGFGESGLFLDHGTLSDVDLQVPWMMVPAASLHVPRGARAPHLASTLDVMPTLLELYGIPVPSGVHGVSQLPALEPGASAVRELAFASGGLSDGFAVQDERYSFQWSAPAMRGDKALYASWYGTSAGVARKFRGYLRDREAGDPPGDLGPSARDPERAAELQARGEEWFEWMDRARDALHDPPWMEEPVTREELEELEARGLVPRGLGV